MNFLSILLVCFLVNQNYTPSFELEEEKLVVMILLPLTELRSLATLQTQQSGIIEPF